MEQIENKIKLESEINSLKREYKYALENFNRVKSDTNDVLLVKERISKEISERNDDLTKILNEISNEKLLWSTKKHEELKEIENLKSEAQNVINWKTDLNKKEEELRQIEATTIEARNEQRTLELKNKNTALEFENAQKVIKIQKKDLEDSMKKFENDKKQFKESVVNVIEEVNKL